jgi:hypothetical protein
MLGANQARAGAHLAWPLSIGYWLVLSFATWAALALATWLAARVLRPWQPPAWLAWTVGAVAGSLAARPLIYGITDLFHPFMGGATIRDMPPIEAAPEFVAYYVSNWSLVLGMWLAACWFAARLPDEPPAAVSQTAAPDRIVPQGFLRRLPPGIGTDVIALQAEDHYIRVHTPAGSALVLCGLADAMATLADVGLRGQRVHRSWWIASGSVAKTVTNGRRTAAILVNGVEVPVSQTYRELARAAGVLDG